MKKCDGCSCGYILNSSIINLKKGEDLKSFYSLLMFRKLKKPYIIAEVGSNHNGNFKIVIKQLIVQKIWS